jgi:hypothetical protein
VIPRCDKARVEAHLPQKRANIRPTTSRITLALDLRIRRLAWRSTGRHREDAGGAEAGAAEPGYGSEARLSRGISAL